MKTNPKFALGAVAAAMLLGLGGCAGMSAQDKSTAIGGPGNACWSPITAAAASPVTPLPAMAASAARFP